tara:strand:+ start:1136 stop:1375 length:240 start_codon:yes stop_codon:yes gene_type:complete
MTYNSVFTSEQRTERASKFGASNGKLIYVLNQLKKQLSNTSEDDINIVSLEIMIESIEQSIALQDELFTQELLSMKTSF